MRIGTFYQVALSISGQVVLEVGEASGGSWAIYSQTVTTGVSIRDSRWHQVLDCDETHGKMYLSMGCVRQSGGSSMDIAAKLTLC